MNTCAVVTSRHRALKPLVACMALALGVSETSHAATLLVTDCTDGTGSGTLRNTIATAIAGDTVQIPPSCSTITLATGAGAGAGAILIKQLLGGLTITGPGASVLTIEAGFGVPSSQVFVSSGSLTLSGMTITGGRYTGTAVPTGGCISSEGNVTLENSTVTGCALKTGGGTHYSKGGAIYAKGNVTLTNSVVENSYVSGAVGALGGGTYALGNVYMTNSIVSGNSAIATAGNLQASGGGIYARKGLIATYSSISNNYASSNGGGIFLRGGGKVYIQYSTISGNRVDSGSGSGLDVDLLYEDIVNIQNSTISGNSGVGAALNTLTYTTISNSTIAFNKATSAFNVPAGLFSLESITMQSTIFANNIGASGGEYDVQSLVGLTGANNLIGATHNTVPPGTLNSCPLLGPLASNGGPTQTHALLLGSPAINAGNNISSLKGDQRGAGFIRVVGAKADIGAYELQSGVTPDRIFASQFEGRCD